MKWQKGAWLCLFWGINVWARAGALPVFNPLVVAGFAPEQWHGLEVYEQGVSPAHSMIGGYVHGHLRVKQNGIAQLLFFRPKVVNAEKRPLVVVAVHGTYVPSAPGFVNPANLYFRGILCCAQALARLQQVPVVVCSYVWKAKNRTEERIAAGKRLAVIINYYFAESSELLVIAHSHGCNVVNVATHYVNRTIDMLVYYASPIREHDAQFECDRGAAIARLCLEELYTPVHFHRLLSFYSLHDVVQIIGGFTTNPVTLVRAMWAAIFDSPTLRYYEKARHSGAVYNVSAKVNGVCPSHCGIIILSWFIPELLKKLDHYQHHTDLIANVNAAELDEQTIVCINDDRDVVVTPHTWQEVVGEQQFSRVQELFFTIEYNGQHIKDESTIIVKLYHMLVHMLGEPTKDELAHLPPVAEFAR